MKKTWIVCLLIALCLLAPSALAQEPIDAPPEGLLLAPSSVTKREESTETGTLLAWDEIPGANMYYYAHVYTWHDDTEAFSKALDASIAIKNLTERAWHDIENADLVFWYACEMPILPLDTDAMRTQVDTLRGDRRALDTIGYIFYTASDPEVAQAAVDEIEPSGDVSDSPVYSQPDPVEQMNSVLGEALMRAWNQEDMLQTETQTVDYTLNGKEGQYNASIRYPAQGRGDMPLSSAFALYENDARHPDMPDANNFDFGLNDMLTELGLLQGEISEDTMTLINTDQVDSFQFVAAERINNANGLLRWGEGDGESPTGYLVQVFYLQDAEGTLLAETPMLYVYATMAPAFGTHAIGWIETDPATVETIVGALALLQ